jgi:hypothetical protein
VGKGGHGLAVVTMFPAESRASSVALCVPRPSAARAPPVVVSVEAIGSA